MFICYGFTESFTLEPVDFVDFKNFDGIRSYPVLKVSFYNPKNGNQFVKTRDESKSSKLMKADKSSEHAVDNVREFLPMSREDIKRMKKLSFHGRSPPQSVGAAVTGGNITKSISRKSPPTQVDYKQRKYTQQQQSKPNRNVAGNQKVSKIANKAFLPHDKGFLPLMRPSPINVHPAEAPSFQTMRNYVDYLKLRQKQFFSDVDDAQELSEQKPTGEVEYFVKREKELADEQRPKLEHRGNDNENVDIDEIDARNDDVAEGADADYEESHEEEESKKKEKFVPFRMYAQVRHVEAENHKPKSEAPSPKATEKLSLEKKNVYYKEEGYEEKDYDHGAEKISSKYRAKRSVDDIKDLPVALAIIKKSDLPKLTGEKLLKHLDRLLKESSIFLPDDDDSTEETEVKKHPSDTIYGSNDKAFKYKTHKYPYYNLPDTKTLNTMSAFRYSENMKNFPSAKESLYKFKNVKECQEVEDDVNPVPEDIEEKGKSTNFNESPKRLKKLGDKISCFKNKYFGKDPFDNPLFKEEYVAASIPIPLKDSSFIAHQANPLITVYDDVISNIRAAFVDELRKQKEQEILANAVSEPLPVNNNIAKASAPDIKIINLKPAVSRLPIFDISKYHPKLNVPSNTETTTIRNIRNDYEMEFIDAPIVVDNSYRNQPHPLHREKLSGVITNLRPPSRPQEIRRRRNPQPPNVKLQITRFFPPSSYFQPPVTQLHDRTKFKLL